MALEFTRIHARCASFLSVVGTGRLTDTLDEEDDGATVQNRAVPLQACGPREAHPRLRTAHRQARQVDILLDKDIACPMK